MSDLLLIVTIANRKVGIRAAEVNSVIALDNVTPVPRVPDYIPGLTALRSRALTVIDCARSLELAEPVALESIASRNAAVVEHDGHLYALLVDDVFDVMEARSEPTPVPGRLASGWKRCAIGLVETDDAPVLLLDLGQVVGGPLEEAA
ncbi:chemotaxis protein CheW [Pseudoblastomonas halimionae]|uniref:Chemotaxis protein CheW n=1 Tax=Alteriqipengyuania halimionae TaxID=1926630 RepID=A0A6I4UA56_9SPHN|nr:chemotaxis protein CheW [Alteriqipengyuania halimionae]MXP11151.1 chemotaxis protein CheW [Alteriqipengyuania halimionae]